MNAFLPLAALGLIWYAMSGNDTPAAPAPRTGPAPALPPSVTGTILETAPNGVSLVAMTSPADLARLASIIGPLSDRADGLKDVLVLVDANGSFLAAFFGRGAARNFVVRDVRFLPGTTLQGLLQNPAALQAVLGWEDARVLSFVEKNGHPISIRALFGGRR